MIQVKEYKYQILALELGGTHEKNLPFRQNIEGALYGETLTFYLFTTQSYFTVVNYSILPKAVLKIDSLALTAIVFY